MVSSAESVQAIYIARGRPDLWQPETKVDHRRVLMPGTWACRRPEDDSSDEFWASRRDIALVHGLHEKSDFGFEKKGDAGRLLTAHFYADLLNDNHDQATDEGVKHKPVAELKVLNTHLGKAVRPAASRIRGTNGQRRQMSLWPISRR